MKLKQIVSAILITAVLLIATACGNNNGNDDPKCECTKGAVHTGECDPACPNGKGNAPCTHTDPVCTCDPKHHDTPCTCGDPDCECTIPKTYDITLRDGSLTITVKYKALPNAEVPEYLNVIKTRFTSFGNNSANDALMADMLNAGGGYILEVEYADDVEVYSGMQPSLSGSRIARVHNDWISISSNSDITTTMMREIFNTWYVQILQNNIIRMA